MAEADSSRRDHLAVELKDIEVEIREKVLVTGVSFVLPTGKVLALTGANGAGKTTVLRVIAGVFLPTRGELHVAGRVAARRGRNRLVNPSLATVLAGDRGLYARLTVEENLRFGAGLAGIPRSRRGAAVERAIATLDVAALRHQRVERLSLGQRQRIRIALSTLGEPRLLLLDEPHTSLDKAGGERLRDVIEEVCQRDGAVVWAAPALEDADLPVDLSVVMSRASGVGTCVAG